MTVSSTATLMSSGAILTITFAIVSWYISWKILQPQVAASAIG